MPDPHRKLTAHLQACHCLPFPAGPVVPRYDTGKQSLWLPALTPAQRAAAAVQWLYAHYSSTDDQSSASVLTRQIRLAAQEWASRHDWFALKTPLLALCSSLGHVSLSDQHLDLVLDKLKGSEKDFKKPGRQPSKQPPDPKPYDARAYRCACMAVDTPDDGLGAPATSLAAHDPDSPLPLDGSDHHHPMAALLALPDGAWTMLTLLFLKLVHTHLAVEPLAGHHPKRKASLYQPLHQLLVQAAQTSHPLADTACALQRVLYRLAPFNAKPADSGAIDIDASILPGCFDPNLPDTEQATDTQAARWLQLGPGGTAQQAQQLVDEVRTLAREVASALTDPNIVPVLPLWSEHLKSLGNLFAEQLKALRKLANGNPHNLPPFAAPTLIARTWRMRQYFTCLIERRPSAQPGAPRSNPAALIVLRSAQDTTT